MASASVAGRSRRYRSPDPARHASCARAVASRSSRPALSATAGLSGAATARPQVSCNRVAARAPGTSGSSAARASATRWSAVRPSASAGSSRAGSVASRAILPPRRRGTNRSSLASARFRASARSGPGAADQQRSGRAAGSSAAGGRAARTAPASSSIVATPPRSARDCRAVSATVSSRSRQAAWAAQPSCSAPIC